MSKRVQAVVPDADYEVLATAARRRGTSMAQLVRQSLRQTAEGAEPDASGWIAAVLRFSRHSAQIEIGRGPLQHTQ